MKFVLAFLGLAVCSSTVASQEQAPVAILRQAQDISPEGSYSYSYETENGISAAETGEPSVQGEEGPAVAARGSYQYYAPDGSLVRVTYVADENGFQPQGDHLPVGPGAPEAARRSL